MLSYLREIPVFDIDFMPKATYYCFPKIKNWNGGSDSLVKYILKYGKVGLLSGMAFGSSDHVRISFATDEKKLIQSMKRMSTLFG